MRITVLKILCGAVFVFAAPLLRAETWQFTFTPYIWATDLEVTAGSSRVATTSQIEFDELLPLTDAAWMSMFEAKYGNWSVMNDTVYTKVSDGASAHSQLDFVSGAKLAAVFEQSTVDLFAGYTPDNSNTTFFGGVRYIALDVSADATITTALPVGTLAGKGSRDVDWVDAVIGVRHIAPLTEKLSATVQVDAGTGPDSEFSSISTATLNYALTDSLQLRAGYRYARIDRDDGELLFDQTTQGWLIAGAFAF